MNPGPSLGSILLHSLLILQEILDGMPTRDVSPFLNTLSLCHSILPRLKIGKLININPGPASGSHPAPMRDIRNRHMISNQIPGLRAREMVIQHAIQPSGLVYVPFHPVLDTLGGIAREMVRLALHRAHAGVHEIQPVVHLVVFAGALREGDLVIIVVLFDEISQDPAGLEEADLLAVREGVCQCGDAAIRIDFEEPSELLECVFLGPMGAYGSFWVFLEMSMFSTL